MKKKEIKLKRCPICGNIIQPNIYPSKKECYSEYQKRKYCSVTCCGEALHIMWQKRNAERRKNEQ